MGYGDCRFKPENGCKRQGSSHYLITFKDKNIVLNVPSMWKHYMKDHLVQPTLEEFGYVMNANLEKVETFHASTIGESEFKLSIGIEKLGVLEIPILYVERLASESGYTHKIGDSPNAKFISKLEDMISRQPNYDPIDLPPFEV